jgi:hypothetical protein
MDPSSLQSTSLAKGTRRQSPDIKRHQEEAKRKQRGSKEEAKRKQRGSKEEAKRKQRGSKEGAKRESRGKQSIGVFQTDKEIVQSFR